MKNKSSPKFSRPNLQILSLAAVAMIGSFALGIQSAGDVRPVSLIEAGSVEQSGDMDGNGYIDANDVQIILEIAQGYAVATPKQLQADPNADGKITVDDAIRLLNTL